jgi:hypothetical protein
MMGCMTKTVESDMSMEVVCESDGVSRHQVGVRPTVPPTTRVKDLNRNGDLHRKRWALFRADYRVAMHISHALVYVSIASNGDKLLSKPTGGMEHYTTSVDLAGSTDHAATHRVSEMNQ